MATIHHRMKEVLPDQITNGLDDVMNNHTVSDFRKFLTNDKVMGFAIGVVVGNTFTDVVKEFVRLLRGIITFISTLVFSDSHAVNWHVIPFADFGSALLSMLLIAGSVFFFMKVLNSVWAQDETEQFGYNATLVETKRLRKEQERTNELLEKLVAIQTVDQSSK
ncbi:MAG: MscL family protein [Lactobacillaceae bacterium]|jgi:large-conductance mechanosensitive channel|nr:MscL family protein [Lactobacillaceae bacterium]